MKSDSQYIGRETKKTRKQIEKAKMVTVTTSTKPLVAKMTTMGIEENLNHLVLKK